MGRPKLGQHFLIDDGVAAREIDYASIQDTDVVLEIGPGRGTLTELLAKAAKQVIAIEIDSKLVQDLQPRLPKNVQLIHDDAVKLDFSKLPPFNKIVANLPFQISSPITFKLLEHKFSQAVLIYQKDFADRMVASPGSKDYSRLSVGVQYKTHCKILEIIPKTCFSPQPKIESCIVELIPRNHPPFAVKDEEFFFEVTKKLFTHRRKKIKNTIEEFFGLQENVPFAEHRVEELSPDQIGRISDFLL